MNFKNAEQNFFLFLSAVATIFAVSMLIFIVLTVAIHALPSLTWYFISTPESATPGIGQGILNAVVGTVIISLFATIIATPFAMGTAVYLSRYAPKNRLVEGLRFLLEVLSGTPSIVLGIFALLVFVYYMKPFTGGYSLIAGSVALAILILPVIERSIETAINSIDKELEEQSYALGATKWQTIRYVTIPCAIAGIITGVILGFGRAAEESAVVILTAGYSQYMPQIGVQANEKFFFGVKIYPFNDLVGTLPYSVYHAYENQSLIPLSNGFAAAFILISFVLIVNIFAKVVLSYSMSGTRRRPGAGCFSSIAATVGGIQARYCRPGKTGNQEEEVYGRTPDMVWFGIRIPHRSPLEAREFFRKDAAAAQTGIPAEEGAVPAGQQGTLFEDPPGEVPSAAPASHTQDPAIEPAPSAGTIPVPGVDPAPAPGGEHTAFPPLQSRHRPSVMDGFAGIILCAAGMAGFLGVVWAVRYFTRDASPDTGSIVLVLAFIAIILAGAAIQYTRLKRREK